MHGRPLATRPIREDDYMPLEAYDLDRNIEDMTEPKFRYFVSATSLRNVGTFGREAQSCFLFDRARIAIETGNSNNIYAMAHDMQNLLAVVMEQIAGRWGIYCGSTQMLIRYAFLLLPPAMLTLYQADFITYIKLFTCNMISTTSSATKKPQKRL